MGFIRGGNQGGDYIIIKVSAIAIFLSKAFDSISCSMMKKMLTGFCCTGECCRDDYALAMDRNPMTADHPSNDFWCSSRRHTIAPFLFFIIGDSSSWVMCNATEEAEEGVEAEFR